MLCNERTDYRLKINIYCNYIASVCCGHNSHHCNIKAISNWFVGAEK